MSDSAVPVRRVNWGVAIAVVWFGCLVLGSFQPRWKAFLHSHGRFHFPLHFAVFAISAMAVLGFASSIGGRFLRCTVLIGLAFVLEAYQSALYPIRFEWRDFVADSCGVLFVLLYSVIANSGRSPRV
jgi:hypothetical protein